MPRPRRPRGRRRRGAAKSGARRWSSTPRCSGGTSPTASSGRPPVLSASAGPSRRSRCGSSAWPGLSPSRGGAPHRSPSPAVRVLLRALRLCWPRPRLVQAPVRPRRRGRADLEAGGPSRHAHLQRRRRLQPPLASSALPVPSVGEKKREKPDKGAPPRSKPPLTSATSAAGGEKPAGGMFCPVWVCLGGKRSGKIDQGVK